MLFFRRDLFLGRWLFRRRLFRRRLFWRSFLRGRFLGRWFLRRRLLRRRLGHVRLQDGSARLVRQDRRRCRLRQRVWHRLQHRLWLLLDPWRRLLSLVLFRPRLFRLTHQPVGFVLRHLAATDHVLHEVARAFEREDRKTGGGTDDFFHRRGHLASGLHADLVRLGGHLGHGVAHVGAAMCWMAPYWRRTGGGYYWFGCGGFRGCRSL